MIDAHCHLHFAEFDADLDTQLDQARAVGVTGFVVCDYDSERRDELMALAHTYDDIFMCLGLHPWAIAEYDKGVLAAALNDLDAVLAKTPGVVALGEVGLDDVLRLDEERRQLQRVAFLSSLELASAHGLPVVIHAVRCHEELLAVLRQENLPCGGMLHGYSGPAELMSAFCDLGFLLSFGTPLTWRGHKKNKMAFIQAVHQGLPFALETDAPSRAPVPHRGQRNEPEMLKLVYASACALVGCTPQELEERSDANLCSVLPGINAKGF